MEDLKWFRFPILATPNNPCKSFTLATDSATGHCLLFNLRSVLSFQEYRLIFYLPFHIYLKQTCACVWNFETRNMHFCSLFVGLRPVRQLVANGGFTTCVTKVKSDYGVKIVLICLCVRKTVNLLYPNFTRGFTVSLLLECHKFLWSLWKT